MYKLYKDILRNKDFGVIRLFDGACIPFDPDNVDYQAFLKYQAEGGVPLPADEVTA